MLPGCLEHYILSLGIMGSKSFLPLWHICNRAPRVWIKITVYFLHRESTSGAKHHNYVHAAIEEYGYVLELSNEHYEYKQSTNSRQTSEELFLVSEGLKKLLV